MQVSTSGDRDGVIRKVASQAVLNVEPQRRDMARVRVRNMLDDAIRQASERDLYEVWLPIAPTSGYSIPASFAVGPLPRPPADGASVQDTLLGLSAASPGAQAVEISGALAVRTVSDRAAVHDAKGELEVPAVRLVSYIVSPTNKFADWTVFTASLYVPGIAEVDVMMTALETFADSMMATVMITAEEAA